MARGHGRTVLVCTALGLAALGCSSGDDETEELRQQVAVLQTQVAEQQQMPTDQAPTPAETPTLEATAEPTPTAEATATAEPVATSEGTSRQSPAPIGTPIDIAGWSIVVNSVAPDGTAAVMAANQFNDPPPADRQFFIASIAATYEGDEEPSSFLDDISISALGPSSVAYQHFDETCGVIPEPLDTYTDVFIGGTIQGNVCWSVLTSDAAQLVMFVEPSFSFDAEPLWLSLH